MPATASLQRNAEYDHTPTVLGSSGHVKTLPEEPSQPGLACLAAASINCKLVWAYFYSLNR